MLCSALISLDVRPCLASGHRATLMQEERLLEKTLEQRDHALGDLGTPDACNTKRHLGPKSATELISFNRFPSAG